MVDSRHLPMIFTQFKFHGNLLEEYEVDHYDLYDVIKLLVYQKGF